MKFRAAAGERGPDDISEKCSYGTAFASLRDARNAPQRRRAVPVRSLTADFRLPKLIWQRNEPNKMEDVSSD